MPVVALVGYTNAGKSTLLNALTTAGVAESAQLFSTLDPVTRRLRLPSGQQVLVTDTVGVIHKLPPMVVAAFRATLEELQEASLLLHMVDVTHHNAQEQVRVVEDILQNLNLHGKPTVLVLNKVDLLPAGSDGAIAPETHARLSTGFHDGVRISAVSRFGLDKLLHRIDAALVEVLQPTVA